MFDKFFKKKTPKEVVKYVILKEPTYMRSYVPSPNKDDYFEVVHLKPSGFRYVEGFNFDDDNLETYTEACLEQQVKDGSIGRDCANEYYTLINQFTEYKLAHYKHWYEFEQRRENTKLKAKIKEFTDYVDLAKRMESTSEG